MTHLKWFKSSRSSGNGACTMCAHTPTGMAVKDSKDPEGPVLQFQRKDWGAFITEIKAGGFPGRGR